MKSYTSPEQSKVLAKILSLESADMRYGYIAPYDYSDRMYDGGYDKIPYPEDFLTKNPNFSANEYDEELPCWSLAALISVLPKIDNYRLEIRRIESGFCCCYTDENNGGDLYWYYADNPINACVAMIEKLNELNML